ncbi:alpha/beta hydrolase [Bacillus sp. 1P06AnD]|uniref:alpha/beta hydrolase n=1 Tax=Bacillus sp. 1P06AnD TaxID=3132208 RepID=UPI0039A0E6E1
MHEQYPVMPGAESFFHKGGEVGILLSHGFIGTPQSVRFLGEQLADRGYTVMAPRLKGHGTHYKELELCTSSDWYQTLKEGYRELNKHCRTVVVMGQSMGGTLALWLASNLAADAVVLINPALSVPIFEQYMGEKELRFIDEGEPDIKACNIHEIVYDKVPIQAIWQLQELMRLTPEKLKNIKCPILAFKSAVDHVVPPECTDMILNAVSSLQKEVITLPNSYHVASMDHDKEMIVQVTDFFIRHLLVGHFRHTS